jgi:hypothetical protein
LPPYPPPVPPPDLAGEWTFLAFELVLLVLSVGFLIQARSLPREAL